MQTPITPLTLGDILDRVFKLIGNTAVRNLILSLIILLPASLILSYGMDHLFSSISGLSELEESGDFGGEGIWGLFSSMGIFFLTLLVFMVATLAATFGVIRVGCSQINAQDLIWQDALSQTFSIRLLRVFGQLFLQYLILGIIYIVPNILFAAGLAAGGSTGMAAGGVLVFLGSISVVAYLWVRWVFAMPAIAWEDAGVFESFKRSSFLVRGYWWRTFWILLLLNIIAQFAIAIISTPVSFIAFSDFFRVYFDMITSQSTGDMQSEILPELMNSFSGTKFVLYIAFSSILSLLISPLITVVMYFDLRARKGEFGEISEADDQN